MVTCGSANFITVSEYTPTELAAGGDQTPKVVLTDTSTSIFDPTAIDFYATNLWIANSAAKNLVEFTTTQLTTSGTKKGHTTLTSTSFSYPTGLAIDTGNAWVVDDGNSNVYEFTAAQLASGGAQVPGKSIRTTTFDFPRQDAFYGPNLWVMNYDSLVEYTSAQLAAGGTVTPHVTITDDGAGSLGSPSDFNFDTGGDIWVVNTATSTAVEFTAAQIASGGALTPNVTISAANGAPIAEPGGEALSQSGYLWISNTNGNSLAGYSPAQVAGGGTGAPAIAITAPHCTCFDQPEGIAFDAEGDLWVASRVDGTVAEFSASALAASGSPTPTVVISTDGTSLDEPVGLAFDAGGDLWVADRSSNRLDEFTPAELAASGHPTPAMTVSATAGSLDGPAAIAFDQKGDAWVTNYTNTSLVEFTPSQLAAGGAQKAAVTLTPDATVTPSLTDPRGVAIDTQGNAWVAGGDEVDGYSPAQLAGGGSPVPARIVEGTTTGLAFTSALALGEAPLEAATPVAAVTGSKVSLSWAAPLDISQVNDYVVTPTLDGVAQPPITTGSNATTFTLPSPTASSTYTFTVQAENFYGTGPASAASNSVTTPAAPPAPASSSGYWEVGADGSVYPFGGAPNEGDLPALGVTVSNIVGLVPSPDGKGYLLVGSDGGIFAFGDATFEGSLPGLGVHVNDIVGVVPSPDFKGYLMIGADGGTFAFGDAVFEGSLPGLGVHVSNIVAVVPSPSGKGYLMIGSDGGTFAFGDVKFYGSLPGLGVSVSDVVGAVASPDFKGYLMIGSDGGTFAFGDAAFEGSLPGLGVHVSNIVAVAPSADGLGYLMVGSDGGAFAFGDATYRGSVPGNGIHVDNIVSIVNA